jgi:hypothetical protein
MMSLVNDFRLELLMLILTISLLSIKDSFNSQLHLRVSYLECRLAKRMKKKKRRMISMLREKSWHTMKKSIA